MKKYLLFFSILLCQKSFSQENQELSPKEVTKIIDIVRSSIQRWPFDHYYLNDIECMQCGGGYIQFPEGKINKAIFTYSNVNFPGIIKNGYFNYYREKKRIRFFFDWTSSVKTGIQSADIVLTFELDDDNSANYVWINFTNGRVENTLKLLMNREGSSIIKDFVDNNKVLKSQNEIERLKQEEARKKDSIFQLEMKIRDSIMIVERKRTDSIKLVKKKYDDSVKLAIQKRNEYYDLLTRRNLKIGDRYNGGIVVYKDVSNEHGLIFSELKRTYHVNVMEADLKSDGWRFPQNNGAINEIKLFKEVYNNSNFRKGFIGDKRIFHLRLVRYCEGSGCQNFKYITYTVKPFNFRRRFSPKRPNPVCYFGVKSF